MGNDRSGRRKVIFINSHPIQYFTPLYRYLNSNGMDTECWYCSDENLHGHLDRQFGTRVAWDIPLLEGYRSRFFKNYSPRPSLYNGFIGLFNPGLIAALFRENPAIVVVHGWSYLTHVLVVVFASLRGHTVCLRGENPLNQEIVKNKLLLFVKRVLLGGILFPFVDYFLFIGRQNRRFYEHYGVKPGRLVFAPYAVDNEMFRQTAGRYALKKDELRAELGIPARARVVLFAAKLIAKKRPMDLVKAYHLLNLPDKCLVIVGDGEGRKEVEEFVAINQLPGVHMAGFVNQSAIGRYYSVADVFVLCSGVGETWGLAVNEAMNFSVPIVVSDTAGCSDDLVKEGVNGFVFRTGDVRHLADCLDQGLKVHARHDDVLEKFSFAGILAGLKEIEDKLDTRSLR